MDALGSSRSPRAQASEEEAPLRIGEAMALPGGSMSPRTDSMVRALVSDRRLKGAKAVPAGDFPRGLGGEEEGWSAGSLPRHRAWHANSWGFSNYRPLVGRWRAADHRWGSPCRTSCTACAPAFRRRDRREC